MSVSRWNYDPARCDGHYCPGDCWWCHYSPDHDSDVDDPYDGRYDLEEDSQ